MPIRKSKKTTPSSAMPATFLASTTVTQYKKRKCFDERAQSQRAKERPGRKIAEHGAKPPAAHHWNDNASRTKDNERIAVGIDVDRRCHSIPLRSVLCTLPYCTR